MGFYEKAREDENKVHISRSKPHSYPSHFHANLEIFILKSGSYTLTINGIKYDIGAGDIAVCDCYDIHDYKCALQGDDCVIIIPFRLLDKYNHKRKNMGLANNVIHDESLASKLIGIIDSYIINETNVDIVESAALLLLSLLEENLKYSSNGRYGDFELIHKILSYIQENYTKDISRSSISESLGYTEAHISRVFHRYMGIGIPRYINGLRFDQVRYLRRSGDKRSDLELIYESGFKSEQSYYRYKNKETAT